MIEEKIVSCAVTGHRKIKEDFNVKNVEIVFINLVKKGYKNFYVGMALGFDQECFKILEKLRKENEIKIIACVPCIDQAKKYSFKDKKEYERMLKESDKVELISREYTPYCMMKRNMFMVDNSSVLVAYLRENKGGTKNTVEYAKNKGIEILYV